MFRIPHLLVSAIVPGILLLSGCANFRFTGSAIPTSNLSTAQQDVEIDWVDEEDCLHDQCKGGDLKAFKKQVKDMLDANCATMRKALAVIESVNNYTIYADADRMRRWLSQARVKPGREKAWDNFKTYFKSNLSELKSTLETAISYTCEEIDVECDIAADEDMCKGAPAWVTTSSTTGFIWLNKGNNLHICIPSFCRHGTATELLHEQTHYAGSVDVKKMKDWDDPHRAQNLEWIIPEISRLPKGGAVPRSY